jgi:glycosyltransferase involved in cell wall biosynthesis
VRICLLGRKPDGAADEGMKNVLRQYAEGLSARHEVRILDPQDILRHDFWTQLRAFRPDILHYLAGPTLSSLILLRALKARSPAKTVVTTIHPWFPLRTGVAIGAFRPDLVLATSRRTAAMFATRRGRVEILPFGVDTSRFVPVDAARKAAWRREFGLPADRYLILHVGHIVRRRGIEALVRLQAGDRQVLVVGSVNTPADRRLRRRLEERGVIVWTKYIPEIEKIYALSDCYAFPTRDPLAAIEIPLSVLEAISCNLPVLATPFGGLPDQFPADAWVLFENRPERWPERIAELRKSGQTQNRSKAIPLDWEKVIAQLEQKYLGLFTEGMG